MKVTLCYVNILVKRVISINKLKDMLRELRKKNDKTQKELADFLGITRPAYTAYESGARQPDYETLKKLADYFGVTTDSLLGRNEFTAEKNKIEYALNKDIELMEFWDELKNRDDLQILFRQTKDLNPETIRRIIRYIKVVEEEEAQEDL